MGKAPEETDKNHKKIVAASYIFLHHSSVDIFYKDYLAHVIEQPNFRIPNPQYFVYLLDQTVGRDILQFIY